MTVTLPILELDENNFLKNEPMIHNLHKNLFFSSQIQKFS